MTRPEAADLENIEFELSQMSEALRAIAAGNGNITSKAALCFADYLSRIAIDLDRMTDGERS